MMEGLTVTELSGRQGRGGRQRDGNALFDDGPKKDGINRCGVILCSLPFYPKIWPDFGALS